MEIINKLISINPMSRPNKKLKGVKGIVIHYVGNPSSTAIANRNYFENLKNQSKVYASAHYIIGLGGEIIRCIPEDEMAYHVGAKEYKTTKLGTYPNDCTIGIECCHLDDKGTMTAATYESLKQLTKDLCSRYKLDPIKAVYIHKDVTGKHCHAYFVNNPAAWKEFKESLKAPTLDPQHVANVKVLHEAGLIGQPEAWYQLDKVHVDNVKALIKKMAQYTKRK